MNDKQTAKKKPMEELEELRQPTRGFEKTEARHKKAEEVLSIVVDALNSSVNGVIITDLKGRIEYVNPAFLRIFGYGGRTEILGKNAADLFPTEDVKKFADVKAIIDERKGETEEFNAQRRDGTTFPVEVSSSNVTDIEGNILGRMASFIDLTERKQAKSAVQESKKQIWMLSSKLMEAEERERKRIAQDIHDIIGSSLTAIKYSLERQMDEMGKEAETEKAPVDRIVSMVKDTLKETKRISRSLRPSILDDLGILSTINWACREFQGVYSGIRIEKFLKIQEEEVPESLKIAIYKLLQEALNNVAKHSEANLVRLSLRKKGEYVELSVEDNGQGFDLKEALSESGLSSGIGLASMKERAELYGGSFEINSFKEKGTAIRVSWPCR